MWVIHGYSQVIEGYSGLLMIIHGYSRLFMGFVVRHGQFFCLHLFSPPSNFN